MVVMHKESRGKSNRFSKKLIKRNRVSSIDNERAIVLFSFFQIVPKNSSILTCYLYHRKMSIHREMLFLYSIFQYPFHLLFQIEA